MLWEKTHHVGGVDVWRSLLVPWLCADFGRHAVTAQLPGRHHREVEEGYHRGGVHRCLEPHQGPPGREDRS